MGYYSTFSGSLTPSKPIPQALIDVINSSDCDLRVSTRDNRFSKAENQFDDGEPGDVVPSSREMKGYNLVQEVFILQKMLLKSGIRLTGEIERVGENSDDFEKIEVVNGRVYVRAGEMVYGRRRAITAEDITKYAIRVYRNCNPKTGKPEHKFAGWLAGRYKNGNYSYALVRGSGKRCFDTVPPPLDAHKFETRKEAETVANEFYKNGHCCEIVSWEIGL